MLSITCLLEDGTRRQHDLPGSRVNVEVARLATKVVVPVGARNTTCTPTAIPERRASVKRNESDPVRPESVTPGTATYAR